ncbi:leucine-rich repeat protein [Segatella bryantii]|uniref:leucine-rich repeat protein n=1 Tax=Segatella bryantii TaxID=77095 RepID=UPI0039C95BB9
MSICGYTFIGCSGLTSATIGNSMTSIDRQAFSDCYGPTSVTIGNSVTKLVDTVYYTSRHILQYQPTFNIVRYIPLQHAQQRAVLNFTDKNPHEVCVFEIAE